jgi:hypothetical protein
VGREELSVKNSRKEQGHENQDKCKSGYQSSAAATEKNTVIILTEVSSGVVRKARVSAVSVKNSRKEQGHEDQDQCKSGTQSSAASAFGATMIAITATVNWA